MKKFLLYLALIATLSNYAEAMTFKEAVDGFTTNVVSAIGYLFMSASVVVFLGGMMKFIWNQREGKDTKDDKAMMTWGILTLFVMVSIFGIIAFAQKTISSPEVNFTKTEIVVPAFNFNPIK